MDAVKVTGVENGVLYTEHAWWLCQHQIQKISGVFVFFCISAPCLEYSTWLGNCLLDFLKFCWFQPGSALLLDRIPMASAYDDLPGEKTVDHVFCEILCDSVMNKGLAGIPYR